MGDYREGFAGGCYVNGTQTCVAQPEDYCDEETFVTAHYLRANHGHPLRSCAGELENVVIGRCGDSGECSNLPSGCENETTWDEFDENCTTTLDYSIEEEGTRVTYGKCGERCVWSPDDCLEGEDYVRNSPDCTANKVQIGACFAGHAFCAVGPAACTQPGQPDEPFWNFHEVKENVGARCYLSSLPAEEKLVASTPPKKYFTPPPIPSPQIFDPSSIDVKGGIMESSFFSSGILQTGGLVGIVAVVAVILGIVIGVSTVYCNKKEDERWRVDTEKEHPPVPKEITTVIYPIEQADSAITDF